MRKLANAVLGKVILAVFGAWCWLIRVPADYEQARRWAS